MSDRPIDPKDADLLALRDRLRQARAERGNCPPWDELKADLLPGGASRPGREERQAHLAICPYCGEHEREWRGTFDFESDRLAAIEKGVASGILRGAQGIARTFGRTVQGKPGKAAESMPPASDAPVYEAPTPSLAPSPAPSPAPPPVYPGQRMYKPPTPAAAGPAPPAPSPTYPGQRMYTPPVEIAAPAVPVAGPSPSGLARVIVVEMADGRTPPQAVYLCAQVLEAEVAQVDSIDELKGDPDLSLVCGVVLGGMRKPDSWPDAVRHARRIVPKRPVILLATYGVEAPAGARRALGEALQSEADPAERLLLALDPELR